MIKYYILKSSKISLLLVLLFLLGSKVFAQVSEGGLPPSFQQESDKKLKLAAEELPEHNLPKINIDSINRKIEEIKKNCTDCRSDYYGAGLDVAVDLIKDGKKSAVANGTITRYVFNSEDAKGLQFYFNEFKLPEGSQLFIYNKEHTSTLGAFTSKNNKDGGKFALQPISGKSITIEYYEPSHVATSPKIEIFKVINVFSSSFYSAYGGDAGSCNIDVACPEASGWDKEIRSVGNVLYYNDTYNLAGQCSGALINNSSNSRRPFFLSAEHCTRVGVSAKAIDFFHWIVLFNYQNQTCGGGDADSGPWFEQANSISGANLLSSKGSTSSDFALFELQESIPASYNACFAGWDKRTEYWTPVPTSVVGIHHPSNDVKKISFSNHSPTYNTKYWTVTWDSGITEPGSSGSPLFDQNHRIVGTLSTGNVTCANAKTGGSNTYGRFNNSFVDGGLSVWLTNTNADYTNTYCPAYPAYCEDGVKNFDETGVDCGGSCPACPPSCSDKIQNQGETGVDCGGPCPSCPPTCFDYIKNQGETGIDCGGPCPACPVPSHTDHIKNLDETGIDCGGASAPPCSTFCSDGILNGDEFETDCGGSCAPCYDYLSNGGFDILDCPLTYSTYGSAWPFNEAPYCINGPWYASHGVPAVEKDANGNNSLRLYSSCYVSTTTSSWQTRSDGVYFQFPFNLDPNKTYTLHFRYKDFYKAGYYPMNVIDLWVANGLKPMGYMPTVFTDAEFHAPTYPINKTRLTQYGTSSQSDFQYSWWNTKFDFTVPNGSYNQLWIHGFNYQYTSAHESYFYMDDFVLTAKPKPCTYSTDYTNTSSLPTFTESSYITAGNNVNITSGQKVRFKAAKSVALNAGFAASSNSTFFATIEDCGQNAYPNFKEIPTTGQTINLDAGIINKNLTDPIIKAEPGKTSELEQLISVVPNPSSEVFQIELKGSFENAEIELYDLYGMKVKDVARGNFLNQKLELNLKGFTSGVYLLNINSSEGKKNIKLILE